MKSEMWLIWKEPTSRRRYVVGSLIYDESKYIFKYLDREMDLAVRAGFKSFPGFENLEKVYESVDMFTNISTRLPNTNRVDYLNILNSYNLDRDSSKFDILKATKGRLVTDNYEFVPIFDDNKLEFDVAGTRHCDDVNKCKSLIKAEDTLCLELDPTNKFDKYAVKVNFEFNNVSYHIGYVPRYYSKQLFELLASGVEYSAMIRTVNFDSNFYDEDITALVKIIFNDK